MIWRPGALTFFGWPNMEDREERVMIRIFAHSKNRFWGLFVREGVSDHVDGDNARLVWIELNRAWSPLYVYLCHLHVLKQCFLRCLLATRLSTPRCLLGWRSRTRPLCWK